MRFFEKGRVKNNLYAVTTPTLDFFFQKKKRYINIIQQKNKNKSKTMLKEFSFFPQVVLCGYNNLYDEYTFLKVQLKTPHMERSDVTQ